MLPGIDLARKRDFGAVVLVFPIDKVYYLLPRFLLPSNCMVDRSDMATFPNLPGQNAEC